MAPEPVPRAAAAEDPALAGALAALTDPKRRAVVQLLARHPHRAGELALALSLSPPALSRHLRVLRQSGLVMDEEPAGDARVRLYRLRPQALAPLQGWLDDLAGYWADQLQAFKAHAEAAPKSPPPGTGP